MELPMTFTMERTFEPLRFASRSAAMESSVSPDWLITITSADSPKSGPLYRNSDARQASTGIPRSLSRAYFPIIPTWYAEPQATR